MHFPIVFTAILANSLVAANPLFGHRHAHHKGRDNEPIANYVAGGDHGDDHFDDGKFIGSDYKRIAKIHMWCDHPGGYELQALQFEYRDNHAAGDATTPADPHGTNRDPKWQHTWTLAKDEFIVNVDIWTYQAHGHTRIGTMTFKTNRNQAGITCGPGTGDKVTWGDTGEALLYVSGSSGKIVDFLCGWFQDSDNF